MGIGSVASAVAIITTISLLSLANMDLHWDSMKDLEDAITSDLISPTQLLVFRAVACLGIWVVSGYMFCDPVGVEISGKSTKGQEIMVRLVGKWRFSTFTTWIWVTQGIYFLYTVTLTLPVLFPTEFAFLAPFTNTTQFLRFTWVLYEISFSHAFLVTVVVTFVMIPNSSQKGITSSTLFKTVPLILHNVNVMLMATECILNKIPFIPSHLPFVAMVGVVYDVFSWYVYTQKGVFYYFFLDYTHPKAIPFLLGLMTAMCVFFFVGVGLSTMANSGVFLARVAVVVVTFMILKFKP